MQQNNPIESKKSKKSTRGFRAIIYNNKIAMIFSLILAFALWIWVSVEKSPIIEKTISSIPVQIDMENSVPSQLNLQVFGKSKYTVDVVITGKRFIVSNIKPEDISVVAQTNYVDSSGNKSLQLKAVANNSKDFDIVRLSQNFIEVYFDTYKELELPIEPRIIAPNEKTVVDGCLLGNIVFSQKSVVISGAATDVNKVLGVVAETKLEAPLEATTTAKSALKLQTENGETLNYIQLNVAEDSITMTMPVLKKVTLPTTVTFKNAPSGYLNSPVPVKVSPSQIEAAVLIEKIDEVKSISVGTVDFSDLKSGKNNFNFRASDAVDLIVVDTNARFKVTIDMTDTTLSHSFSVPAENISIVNQKHGFQSTVIPETIANIKIYGTEDEIIALTNDMMFIELDLADEEIKEGKQTVLAHVIVKGNTKAWAGDTYPVQIESSLAE